MNRLILFLFLLVFLSFLKTGTAQELIVRPNDTTSNHIMVEPTGSNFGTYFGLNAGNKSMGCCNTFIGAEAGQKNTSGTDNTFLGTASGNANQTGSLNTYLGRFSGRYANGSNNLFIGYAAGENETGNDKLYINHGGEDKHGALIYGDFDSKFLRINDRLGIGRDASTFPLEIRATATGNSLIKFYDNINNEKWHTRIESDGSLGFTESSVADQRFVLVPGGNVGINAYQNSSTLNVKSSATDTIMLNLENENGDDIFQVKKQGLAHLKTTSGNSTLCLEADTDNNNDSDNPQIEFKQDAGLVKASIGFDEAKLGSNIFGVSTLGNDKALLINQDGNVGINQIFSSSTLNVRANAGDSNVLNLEDETGDNKLTVSNSGRVGINQIIGNVRLNVRANATDNSVINIEADTGADLFTVDKNGHVGINQVYVNSTLNVRAVPGAATALRIEDENGDFLFQIFPNGFGVIAGILTQNSDIRLKKNISSLTNNLANIQQLSGYHYHWKVKNRDPDIQIGFLAQELQKVYPELVKENPESGMLSVNYSGMIPVLVEGIKEQQVLIDQKSAEVDDLKNQIRLQEKRLQALEVVMLSGK